MVEEVRGRRWRRWWWRQWRPVTCTRRLAPTNLPLDGSAFERGRPGARPDAAVAAAALGGGGELTRPAAEVDAADAQPQPHLRIISGAADRAVGEDARTEALPPAAALAVAAADAGALGAATLGVAKGVATAVWAPPPLLRRAAVAALEGAAAGGGEGGGLRRLGRLALLPFFVHLE